MRRHGSIIIEVTCCPAPNCLRIIRGTSRYYDKREFDRACVVVLRVYMIGVTDAHALHKQLGLGKAYLVDAIVYLYVTKQSIRM